jgi:hypothetical protein
LNVGRGALGSGLCRTGWWEGFDQLVAPVAGLTAANDANLVGLALLMPAAGPAQDTGKILPVRVGAVGLDHALHDAVEVLGADRMLGIHEPVGMVFIKRANRNCLRWAADCSTLWLRTLHSARASVSYATRRLPVSCSDTP